MAYKFEETAIYQGDNKKYWRLSIITIFALTTSISALLLSYLFAFFFDSYIDPDYNALTLTGEVWELKSKFPIQYWTIDAFISTCLLFIFFLFFKTAHSQRSFISLINNKKSINWRKILHGIFIFLFIRLIIEVFISFNYISIYYCFDTNHNYSVWSIFLAILTIFVNATIEEIIFRGYLLQGFYARTKNKLITIIIVSIIFGFSHNSEPDIEKMVYHIFTGLILTIITLKTQSIEYTIGIHFISNLWLNFTKITMTKKVEVEVDNFFAIYSGQHIPFITLFLALIFILVFYKNKDKQG